jgi:hypothetical protein
LRIGLQAPNEQIVTSPLPPALPSSLLSHSPGESLCTAGSRNISDERTSHCPNSLTVERINKYRTTHVLEQPQAVETELKSLGS